VTDLPVFLLDTHALYWHLIDSPRLSAPAAKVFEDAQAGKAVLIVHYIALAELYYLLQKHQRSELYPSVLQRLEESGCFRLEAMEFAEVRDLDNYREIPEMHDRMLVIAAKRLGATLMTRDQSIQSAARVPYLW
jgi:PIN domain nuclease of toxin-antitoxin system